MCIYVIVCEGRRGEGEREGKIPRVRGGVGLSRGTEHFCVDMGLQKKENGVGGGGGKKKVMGYVLLQTIGRYKG